jgi:hypothetical protein
MKAHNKANTYYEKIIFNSYYNIYITYFLFFIDIISLIVYLNENIFPRSPNYILIHLSFISPQYLYRLFEDNIGTITNIDNVKCYHDNTYLYNINIQNPQLIYLDNLFVLQITIIFFIVAIITCFVIIKYTLHARIIKFCSFILNVFLRHFTIFIFYMTNNYLLTELYTNQIDKNSLPAIAVYTLIEIILMIIIVYYITWFNAYYNDSPYDNFNLKYYYSLFGLNLLSSILYSFQKFCFYSPYLYLFLSYIYVTLLIVICLYFFFSWRTLLYLNIRFNRFRFIGLISLLNFTIYKLIQLGLNINDLFMDTIIFILYLVSIGVVYYIFTYYSDYDMFNTTELVVFQLVYLSESFIKLLKQDSNINHNSMKQFFNKLKKDIYLHTKKCKLSDCFLCNEDNPLSDSIYKKESISLRLSAFFLKFLSPSFKCDRIANNNFYFIILRINTVLIKKLIESSKNIDFSILFLFLEILSRPNVNNYIPAYYSLMLRVIFTTSNKDNAYIDINTKMLELFNINRHFDQIITNSIELIKTFNSNFDITRINELSTSINNSKSYLENRLVNSVFDKSDLFYFACVFNFRFIYNYDLIKNFSYLDNVKILEEYNEELKTIVIEFETESKNLYFKSLCKCFLNDLGYERDELKNKGLDKIFPNFIASNQTSKIIKLITKDSKESFSLKFLVIDKNSYIKFYNFSFKVLVDNNYKIYLFTQFPKPSIVNNTKKHDNLVLINEIGDILYMNKNFYDNILMHDSQKYFYELVNNLIMRNFLKTKTKVFINARDLFISKSIYEGDVALELSLIKFEDLTTGFHLINIKRKENTVVFATNIQNGLYEDSYIANFDDPETVDEARIGSTSMSSTLFTTSSEFLSITDDHLPRIIVENKNDFMALLSVERKLRLFEKFNIAINFIMIVGGISFLIFINNYFKTYKYHFVNLEKIKSLESYLTNQMILALNHVDLPGSAIVDNPLFSSRAIKNEIYNFLDDIIINEYKNISSYLEFLGSGDLFYQYYFTDKVDYISYNLDTSNKAYLNIESVEFYMLLQYLFIHINNLDLNLIYQTRLDVSEMDYYDVSKSSVYDLIFMFQNSQMVFFNQFEKLTSEYVYPKFKEYTNDAVLVITEYNIVLLLIHFITLTSLAYCVIYNYKKIRKALWFLFNFEETHFKSITKKLVLIQHIVDFLISPTDLVNHLKANNKRKASLDKSQQILEKYKSKINKDFPKDIEDAIYKLCVSQYIKYLSLIFALYLLFFLTSYYVFDITFETMNISSQFIIGFYDNQIEFLNAYMLVKLALLTDMKLSTLIQGKEKLITPEDYITYFEHRVNNSTHAYITTIQLVNNYDKFADVKTQYELLSGANICDIIITKDNQIYSQFAPDQIDAKISYLNAKCKGIFQNEGNINEIVIHILTDLRTILYDFESDNIAQVYDSDEFRLIGEKLFYIFSYYSYIGEKYLGVILNEQLNNSYIVCIILFIVEVVIDIFCFILSKKLIITSLLGLNNAFINIISMMRK